MAPSWSPCGKESTELVTQDGAESRMKSPVIQGIRHALAMTLTMTQSLPVTSRDCAFTTAH